MSLVRKNANRFYLPGSMQEPVVSIDGEEYHHLRRVLRLQEGDSVLLFNGTGLECDGVIRSMDKKAAHIEIRSRTAAEPAPVRISLAWSLCKARATDLIVYKATELGVSSLVPFRSERSSVQLVGERVEHAVSRWKSITIQAAKQSGNPYLPHIEPPLAFDDMIEKAAREHVVLVAMPGGSIPLKDALPRVTEKMLFVVIGPEGGLDEKEIEVAANAGAILVSLGPNILRVETAAIFVVSAIRYECGW